jgi:hypothetical protein
MRRSTLSTALYVSLVFLSGGVVGGFAHRLYMVSITSASVPKPDEWRRKNVDEMRTRLTLSDQQITQLTTILDTTKARFHEVKVKWDKEAKRLRQPEMKAIQEDQIRQINEILSEQQRSEYEKLRAERDKRRQQNSNTKPPVPSGD